MKLQDFLRLMRTRWITVCASVLVAVVVAIAVTLMTTPQYQASTRLFVSASAGNSASDVYQGNRFSQERVVSYAQLLMGETLAQRTVDKLGLDMTAASLQQKVSATAKTDTVLIDVHVLDPSPVRARDIANALSDEFVTMVRELETPEGAVTPDARVVVEQRATVPSSPVTPKKVRNLLLGVVAGFVLGIGLAIVRDLLDNTVKSREVLEEITDVGVVGGIQLDKERRKNPAILFGKDNSAIAESFRKLRTNLSFLTVDNPPRVIVVTSSIPNEGKSTTAINIALALAESGNNVALVDGDMRRPTVHKYLDLVGPVGFSTVLSGAVPLTEALQKTQFDGLTVLAAGTTPPNPSELLASQAATKVLAELRAHFDYVIVDSSPLLAVTDSAILAANADGALIMVRYGQTKREQLAQAVETLHGVGATLLGAVFTMIPSKGSGAYAYSYSYYGESKEK
ncbi:tyrosine-protein kinase domain-containing protein [Mycolicibacterium fluoranthenivorans]|uniref:polysaccharide biosynthesis tyrosine autokinase n=1 Tax=Mycolicibacterium fluoranthenivorans TaxID=258505 RepID=UPI0014219758|nr:polysaccharide biosynthesis tyrosine autokinase [Mycolicibacterium fluoranthenivorans]MCV7359260.1 polysaccharide biosynthesis tyrosine autokinase [Mycolicibacterium fluoranthenivorans]